MKFLTVLFGRSRTVFLCDGDDLGPAKEMNNILTEDRNLCSHALNHLPCAKTGLRWANYLRTEVFFMRILMLIDGLGIGGAETHVVTLAAAMQRAGAQVSVLSCGGVLESALKERSVTCLRFPAPMHSATGWLRNALYLRRLLKQQPFDVLHAHTRRCALMLRLLPQKAPRRMAKVWRGYRTAAVRRALAPVRIVTAHAAFSSRFARLSYWGEATIAVSEDIRAHLARHFSVGHAVRVLPNGIEMGRIPPTVPPHGEFSVVFASRLDRDCSHSAELLLRMVPTLATEAARRGKRFRLCILGGGECLESLRDLWKEICAKQSTLPPTTVDLPGGVGDVRAYFAAAQVFVGVSRAALEALGCGCAVVLSGNEGYGGLLTPETFDEHAATNFCCRGQGRASAATLLEALLPLLDEPPEVRRARHDALLPLLRRRYDVDALAAKTLRLYQTALSQKRRLNVLCAGYFGRGNLGDEAILRCLMRRLDGAVAPRSLAAAPWYAAPPTDRGILHVKPDRIGTYRAKRSFPQRFFATPALPGGGACKKKPHAPPLRLRLHVLWRDQALRGLGQQLRQADALLLGGGSLLQNGSRHGNRSLLYYLGLCVAAWLAGCPFSLRANGIGPLHRRWARHAVGWTLRLAAGISVRDESSRQLLVACGVPGERIALLEDGVAAWLARRQNIQTTPLPTAWQGGYVCICPRGGEREDAEQLLAIAHQLASTLPRLYLALDERQDVVGCHALSALAPGTLIRPRNEREATVLLGGATAVVSMRLHALILSGKRPKYAALLTPATRDKLLAELVLKNNKNTPTIFEKGLYKRKKILYNNPDTTAPGAESEDYNR